MPRCSSLSLCGSLHFATGDVKKHGGKVFKWLQKKLLNVFFFFLFRPLMHLAHHYYQQCVCFFLSDHAAGETKREKEKHLCSCVSKLWRSECSANYWFWKKKASHWDDEEACPVKWLLCEISCRWLIPWILYSLLPVLQNSLGLHPPLGCAKLHSDPPSFKEHSWCLNMICRRSLRDCSGSRLDCINCFFLNLFILAMCEIWREIYLEIHQIPFSRVL